MDVGWLLVLLGLAGLGGGVWLVTRPERRSKTMGVVVIGIGGCSLAAVLALAVALAGTRF